MKIYYIEFRLGCFLHKGKSEQAALKYAKEQYGLAHGPYYIRLATKEDIGHVEAMGGYIPE